MKIASTFMSRIVLSNSAPVEPSRVTPDVPDFAAEAKERARFQYREGNWKEARSLYFYIVEISERIFGRGSPDVRAARNMFADIHSAKTVDRYGRILSPDGERG
jgi:hypothetical protein